MNDQRNHVSNNSSFSPGVEFHQRIASQWSGLYSHGSFSRRLAFMRAAIERNVERDTNWLDLGCGAGNLSIELSIRDAKVTAVDGAPQMLREAEKNLIESGFNDVRWIQSDVAFVEALSSGNFDGVLCSSVAEYVEDPSQLFKEISRILRPDGKLIISVPPRWSIVRLSQKAVRGLASIGGIDKYAYLAVSKFEIQRGKLQQIFLEEGFKIHRASRFDPIVPQKMLDIFNPSLLIIEAWKIGS